MRSIPPHFLSSLGIISKKYKIFHKTSFYVRIPINDMIIRKEMEYK